MNSPTVELRGAQRPRIECAPDYDFSLGKEAVDLAAQAGLILDPWQAYVLERSMGEREENKWAAMEVGLVVPRQNGKGSVLEAREIHALFLEPGTRLILHSAHEFKTASEAFIRVKTLIDNTPALSKRVKKMRTSHGEEGVELHDGSRLRFVARSTGSGRGFTGDLVILDEAYALSAAAMAALMPTLSARPNPQLWYTSSAGMVASDQLRSVRARGKSNTPGRLAYFEWSAPEDCELDDHEMWAMSNPGLGIRISEDFVEAERGAMPDPDFARERLGIWAEDGRMSVIDPNLWTKIADEDSRPDGKVVFAVDASPGRDTAAIASAGRRSDGRLHVKVVRHGEGLGWVVDHMVELHKKYKPNAVLIDPAGPAGAFLADLADHDIIPELVNARQMAQACGAFHDDVVNDRLRHCDQDSLTRALRAATTRKLNDAWAWDRRESGADISPLVAVTLAAHGYRLWGTGGFEPMVAYL